MRVVAIIQARMGSTRLPGKSMMPLGGKPLVQNVIERVQRATRLDSVILAYPTKDSNGMYLVGSTFGYGGDPNDLVGRYLACAEHFNADLIVRICADNPCIEPEYIDIAVERYFASPYVFYSNTTDYAGQFVDGIGAEVFSVSRLKWLDNKTSGNAELREHPHKYFEYPLHAADVRLDINTQSDYDFIKDIYDHFGHNRFHVSEVLGYLGLTR